MIDRRSILLAGAAFLATQRIGNAQDTDPRRAVIQKFYDALIDVMKEGSELGFDGRFDRLTPVIRSCFDIDGMIARAIGAAWESLDDGQRKGVASSFERFMIASYASRFKSFSGQVFELTDVRESAGKPIVLTRLIKSDGEAVPLGYVIRETQEGWKIADVYYSGTISEVARLRSDFSSTLQSGGVEALISALDHKVDEMRMGD